MFPSLWSCRLGIVLSFAVLLPHLAGADSGKKSVEPTSEADRLFRLAQEYNYGQGRKFDLAKAASFYRQANEKGHPLAAGFLGALYANGYGVKKDEEKARKLCSQVVVAAKATAEKGSVQAQHLLGLMHDHGLGVAKNDKEAVRWYRKAAEQGLAWRRTILGGCTPKAGEWKRTRRKPSAGFAKPLTKAMPRGRAALVRCTRTAGVWRKT